MDGIKKIVKGVPPMSAILLAPIESREVVRCESCRLMQYRTANPLCRRCHTSLDSPEPEPELPPLSVLAAQALKSGRSLAPLPKLLRTLRIARDLSQDDLAKKTGFKRTYISKVENGGVEGVCFLNLERYAGGFDTRGSSLMALLEDRNAKLARPLARVDETILRYIGPTFRRLREESGKSQSQVIDSAELNPKHLCCLETGRKAPSLYLLGRLAAAIGKPTSVVIMEIENAAYPNG